MQNRMNKLLKLMAIVSTCVISIDAGDIDKTIIATKHNTHLTLGEIAEIQPGLGTIMIEFGHRFYVAYYAAKASNWGLADYEIHELIEAQEVAEATRPKYTEELKAFEHGTLAQLQKTIKAKNWKQFEVKYAETTKACNACHTKNGHPYIQYQLPKGAPKYLRMELK